MHKISIETREIGLQWTDCVLWGAWIWLCSCCRGRGFGGLERGLEDSG